jgi:adenylosuccinate lyase
MIPRYTNPEMAAVWSDETRYRIWLEIERCALEGLVQVGAAPQEALDAYNSKAQFSIERVQQIEREVKHDVIAFLTNVAEYVGPLSRFVHRGMTSSDVLDTCLAVQLKQSGELLSVKLEKLLTILAARSREFKSTPCIGRSHGIHAEPMTFGMKLAGWYSEMKRHQVRLARAIETVATGKISGAVGTYAGIDPHVEAHVMKRLGLTAETVATQVVSRDRHAEFLSCLAGMASSIERFSVEIRHLQRTEVREAMEGFTPGQKGSSAMPHKRNPILTENLTGLARLVRSYAQATYENVALWHERDISHSSVERVVMPDATIVMDFMLARFEEVVRNLVVSPERMMENLQLTRGTIFSGHLLLALVDSGITREDAYALVQKHALAAWDGGAGLEERVRQDAEITNRVSQERLAAVFDLAVHLAQAERICERALVGE